MDNRFKVKNEFKNETQYGTIHNVSLEFQIDQEYAIYFSIKRLPKRDGGYYWQWPQTVYNKDLAKQTNYEKGVEKHLFGNAAFGKAAQSVALTAIEGVPSKGLTFTPQTEDDQNINLEEIKF